MSGFEVTVQDNATPELLEFIETLTNRRPLNAALGSRLADELVDHFDRENAKPNSRGWPKQDFWADVGDTTGVDGITDEAAAVKIAHPAIRQKIHGGTITPKRGKALAIPLTARAYAAGSPREGSWGDDLFFLDRGAGKAPLLATEEGEGKISAEYILLRSVTQRPDPDALPDRTALQDALDDEFIFFTERHLS